MRWVERTRLSPALGLFLLLCLAIGSWKSHAEQLPIKTYTTADGLVRDGINRIIQDSHGYLWFCTAEGLSRFDGYKFTNYTTADGLPSGAVSDLLETRDGIYLVATAHGLSQFNPRGAPMFAVWRPAEPGAQSINALLEDRAGQIWCATYVGLYRLERTNGEWRFHFVDLGLPLVNPDSWVVEALVEDTDGALWIGTRGSGLCRRWPDGRTEHFTVAQGLPGNRITALLQDHNKRLWVGTTDGLCRLFANPDLQPRIVARLYTTKDGLIDNWVSALFVSTEGKLLVGAHALSELVATNEGAHPQFRSFTTAQGLSDQRVVAMAEDRDGNLWLGSTNGGAMKIARNGFKTFLSPVGINDGEIHSIFQDSAGQACAFIRGTREHEFISCFDGQQFSATSLNLPSKIRNLGWGFGQEALQNHAGEWWAPTGEGLFRFPPVSRPAQLAHVPPKNIYTRRSGLVTDEVFTLFEDSKSNLWIGSISPTDNGLTRMEQTNGTLHTFTEAEGLPSRNVLPTAFAEDRDGDVWVGFSLSAIARYRSGHFEVFTTRDGSPEGWIHAMYCDHSGRLWVSGGQSGVKRIDDPGSEHPSFVSYAVAEGLSSNKVNSITEDQWGRLYFGTGRGLDRLDPATGRIKHYTAADGLVRGEVRFALRDQSGALWFGNETQISRLTPEADRPEPAPPILIAGLQVAGIASPLSQLGETEVGPLKLAAGQNQISIEFVAPEFDPGEVLRYQHRLEGADRDWSSPSEQRVINYERLAPGTYRFLVRAVTAEGILSPRPAVVAFTISPPVWRQWWFVTLAVGLAGFLVFAAHRYRVARLLELERVRTRIASDLHDDIGSSLSRMAILSEVAKQRMAGTDNQPISILTDIAESARGAADSMSDIVWAIDPRRDDLSSVVFRVRQFASDLLGSKGISWHLQVPAEFDRVKLNPEQRRHIFLIFKEAIINSVRHAACSSVKLELRIFDNQIVGEIRDDGHGFVIAPPDQCPGNGTGGHGLENLRARAGLLGGHLSFASSSAGTSIRLVVPLKKP